MLFRWIALVTLISCLSISIYYRRQARKKSETIPRGRESALVVAVRLVVGLPLWLAILLYVVNPGWMQWASFAAPEWLRWTGAVLGLCTVPAAYWVFSSLGSNVSETVLTKQHHELVSHGPYRWIRHPLYSMAIGLVLAIGLLAANWAILLLGSFALAMILVGVIPVEEKALLETFGDEYRDYMGRTGRMLPTVRSE